MARLADLGVRRGVPTEAAKFCERDQHEMSTVSVSEVSGGAVGGGEANQSSHVTRAHWKSYARLFLSIDLLEI